MESGSRPIEGVGTAVAAFVGLAAKGPVNEPTLVSNWSQFTQTFGEFVEGSYLAHAVYGYFMNGGGNCYVVRIGGNGNGEGPQAQLGGYRFSALEQGPAGNGITVEVADPTPGEGVPDDAFKLVVKQDGRVAEQYDPVTAKAGQQNVVTLVNQQSRLIRIEAVRTGGALAKPAKGSVSLAGGSAPEPDRFGPDDYVGDVAERTRFGGLEAVDPITMVCAPDLMAAYQRDLIDLEASRPSNWR